MATPEAVRRSYSISQAGTARVESSVSNISSCTLTAVLITVYKTWRLNCPPVGEQDSVAAQWKTIQLKKKR